LLNVFVEGVVYLGESLLSCLRFGLECFDHFAQNAHVITVQFGVVVDHLPFLVVGQFGKFLVEPRGEQLLW
jgi:hypothetical protein